jgi:GNAT superfamily N-acetyltransferase
VEPLESALLQTDLGVVTICRATLADIVDLRHRVLRFGLPREAAIFDGDDRATSRHFAAFYTDRVVTCATFHENQWQGEPAWQLRGMATEEAFRSKGVGRALLAFAESALRRERPEICRLWANARVPAARFYQSLGWEIASEIFDIPTAGPHYRMTKPLTTEHQECA